MNKENYLRRIGIENYNILPNLENLKLLQKRHLLNIPFENLDIYIKCPIVLKTEHFAKKILEEKRGGFCYELNGLFCELLNKIGYKSRIISARVSNGKSDLRELTEMCDFHLTSPESHFTRGKVCSILTNNGRKTFTYKKFIETKNGEKIEFSINSNKDFERTVLKKFDINLES